MRVSPVEVSMGGGRAGLSPSPNWNPPPPVLPGKGYESFQLDETHPTLPKKSGWRLTWVRPRSSWSAGGSLQVGGLRFPKLNNNPTASGNPVTAAVRIQTDPPLTHTSTPLLDSLTHQTPSPQLPLRIL